MSDDVLTTEDYEALLADARRAIAVLVRERNDCKRMFAYAVSVVGRVEIPKALLLAAPRPVSRSDPVDRDAIVFATSEPLVSLEDR